MTNNVYKIKETRKVLIKPGKKSLLTMVYPSLETNNPLYRPSFLAACRNLIWADCPFQDVCGKQEEKFNWERRACVKCQIRLEKLQNDPEIKRFFESLKNDSGISRALNLSQIRRESEIKNPDILCLVEVDEKGNFIEIEIADKFSMDNKISVDSFSRAEAVKSKMSGLKLKGVEKETGKDEDEDEDEEVFEEKIISSSSSPRETKEAAAEIKTSLQLPETPKTEPAENLAGKKTWLRQSLYILSVNGEEEELGRISIGDARRRAKEKYAAGKNLKIQLFQEKKGGKRYEVDWKNYSGSRQAKKSRIVKKNSSRSHFYRYIVFYKDGKNTIRHYLGDGVDLEGAKEIAKAKKLEQDARLFHVKRGGNIDELSIKSSGIISKNIQMLGIAPQTGRVSRYLLSYKDSVGNEVKDYIGNAKKKEIFEIAKAKSAEICQPIAIILLSFEFLEKEIAVITHNPIPSVTPDAEAKEVVNSNPTPSVTPDAEAKEVVNLILPEPVEKEIKTEKVETPFLSLKNLEPGQQIQIDFVLGGILSLKGVITLLQN